MSPKINAFIDFGLQSNEVSFFWKRVNSSSDCCQQSILLLAFGYSLMEYYHFYKTCNVSKDCRKRYVCWRLATDLWSNIIFGNSNFIGLSPKVYFLLTFRYSLMRFWYVEILILYILCYTHKYIYNIYSHITTYTI